MDSLSDPESLWRRADVDSRETTRAFDNETFEALRERYETIDGVVQVGVTTAEGEVLLMGPDGWVPPGGDVEHGEDWVVAARRVIEELTDVAVEIDRPELIERTIFRLENDDSQFTAYVVHFRASLAEDETEFINDPRVADDLNHEYIDDEDAVDFAWFDEIPEDAHLNHEDHIEIFID